MTEQIFVFNGYKISNTANVHNSLKIRSERGTM